MLQEIPFDWKQEILTRLDVLGSKMGTVSGQVWEALLRQQRVEFFIQLGYFCIVLFVAVTMLGTAFGMRRGREEGEREFFDYSGDPTSAGVVLCISIALFLISFIVGLVTIGDLDKLLNPGYTAMKSPLILLRR